MKMKNFKINSENITKDSLELLVGWTWANGSI